MNDLDLIRKELEEAQQMLGLFLSDSSQLKSISKAADLMVTALKNKGTIYACGNGGSMSDAMHFAEELTGRFRDDRPSYAGVAISDPAFLTCTANDYGFDKVFSRFLEGVACADDVLLAISTSGNSMNIVNAVYQAKELGMTVVALTGKGGGKLATLADVELRAPHSEYADRAQELHIKIIHCLVALIEQKMA